MIHGNTRGLPPSVTKRLEKLGNRRVPPAEVVTQELSRQMTELSRETGRQVGVLIDRRGRVVSVMVGTATGIEVPEFGRQRAGAGRLRGLRMVHTHLRGEELTQDDLTDLALLRLDLVAAITADDEGLPERIHVAHLLPPRLEGDEPEGEPWEILPPAQPGRLAVDFEALIGSLEEELTRVRSTRPAGGENQAVLVSVSTGPKSRALESLAELLELARTARVPVVDSVVQIRRSLDPRTLIGKGKLQDLVLRTMSLGADLLIFDRDLTPAQMQSISEATELRVLDRTQLILDIFAQRARSRDGKLQVELAQQRYRLPRLRGKGDAMSRLMGGIGGRGPGETRLEVDRRRVRERIHRLERELESLSTARDVRRRRRNRKELPVCSIVGYTNAGKSTLLRALTGTDTYADDRLFATLDTASRRLRFPRDREVIVTDTVGFLRDLPRDLVAAFRATLEELEDADLLLHVVDASAPDYEEKIAAVRSILRELQLDDRPTVLVFNKIDRLDGETAAARCRRAGAIGISALEGRGLDELVEAADGLLPPIPVSTS